MMRLVCSGSRSGGEQETARKPELINREESREEETAEIVPDGRSRGDVTGIALALEKHRPKWQIACRAAGGGKGEEDGLDWQRQRSGGRGRRAVHSWRFADMRAPKRSPTSSSTHCGGARPRLLPSAPSHGGSTSPAATPNTFSRNVAGTEPRALRNGCRHLDREFYERGRRSHKSLRVCLAEFCVSSVARNIPHTRRYLTRRRWQNSSI